MIIKSFAADSASAALKRVRDEMGGDAIVLKTRQVPDTGGRLSYEVTACLERPTVGQISAILPDSEAAPQTHTTARRLQLRRAGESGESTPTPSAEEAALQLRLTDMERKLDRLLEAETPQVIQPGPAELERRRLAVLLQDADFDDESIASVIGEIDINADVDACREAAERTLTARLASFMTPEFKLRPGDRVAVIGPAGAGKSSVLGKLAAQLVARDRQKVTLLTLDNRKLGAFDEVCTYAAVLGADVADPLAEDAHLNLPIHAVTLIDTPALTADDEELKQLRGDLERFRTSHRVAVFSALTRRTDQVRLAVAARELGLTHTAVTMMDLTHRVGSAIAAAATTGTKIAVVSDTPGGVGAISVPDPLKLAKAVLSAEVIRG